MARCIRIPLGPFEKYFILRARRDTAFAVSSYWELDRPPDPARLRRALEALRPLCPVFFSTLAVDETDPLQLVAVCDPDRPIDDFLSVHDTWTGAPGEFFRRKVLPAPDPWAEGLFRLLAVTGPIPLLGFHIPHTIADGFTANAFQQLFVELYTEGPAWRGSPPRADFAGTRMPIQWLRRTFKPGLLNEPALKPHATRPLSLSLPAGISPTDIEVRVVRHSLSTREFAGVFDRALAYGVSTVQYMAGCLAVAMDRTWDPWSRSEEDFFAVNIPTDIRRLAGLKDAWGNLSYPVGIPLRRADLTDLKTAAQTVARRFRAGRTNYFCYLPFAHELAAAQRAVISPSDTASPAENNSPGWAFSPLAEAGATEIAPRIPLDSLGPARILGIGHQSPIVVRRAFRDTPILYFSLRWHPSLADRLTAFVNTFFNAYLDGRPETDKKAGWELL